MLRPSIAPIPPGALDLTGEAVRKRRALQRGAMEHLATAGFAELIPPTFEYEEVFRRAAGRDIGPSLIRFLDLDGRSLALRYDFTSSVARVAATTFSDATPPFRFCYSGKVFRQGQDAGSGGRGRPRELLQAGGEILGLEGLASDLEVIRLVLTLLAALGLTGVRINLGHAAVLAPILDTLDAEARDLARRAIGRRDARALTDLLAEGPAATALADLPFVIGRRDALQHAALTAPPAAARGIAHLVALDEALTPPERAQVVYDLGEVRGLDYYTGMHFEVFVEGAGRAVGTGGRYDDLMGRFGTPMPAVGFALDLGALAGVIP